jgi:hypothetical protein
VVPRISGLRSTFKIPRENSTIFEWAEENVTSTQENRSLIKNYKLKTNENSSPSATQRSLQPQLHESAYSSDCDSEDNEFSDFVLVRNRSINEVYLFEILFSAHHHICNMLSGNICIKL